MRMKFFPVLLLLPFILFSQAEKRLKTIDESRNYYSSQGDLYFHIDNCPKLFGVSKLILSYPSVKARGLKPCPECMYEERKISSSSSYDLPTLLKQTTSGIQKINMRGSFRQTEWGMNTEQIKKMEKVPFVQDQTSESSGLKIRTYKGNSGGHETLIGYYFAENKLVEGRYVFLDEHSNHNLYLNDFLSIKKSLIEKYGNPQADDRHWMNDLYKNDPDEWGMAVSVGHLVLEATWVLLDTEIVLQLKGDNYKISLTLDYESTLPEHISARKKAADAIKKVIW